MGNNNGNEIVMAAGSDEYYSTSRGKRGNICIRPSVIGRKVAGW